MFGTKKRVVLFQFILVCLTSQDLDSSKTSEDKNVQSTGQMPVFTYFLNLSKETKYICGMQKFKPKTKNTFRKTYNFRIYNFSFVNNVIQEMKENNSYFYKIMFTYTNTKEELVKFIKCFINRLQQENIQNFRALYKVNHSFVDFYDPRCFYFEIWSGEIFLLFRYNQKEVESFRKIKVLNTFLDHLMISNSELYLKNIKELEMKNFFKEYFLNYRLLFFNFEFFENEKNLEKKFPYQKKIQTLHEIDEYFKTKEKKLPDIRQLNILFHFLQDSKALENMVKEVMSDKGSEDCMILKRILFDLDIKTHEIMINSKSITENRNWIDSSNDEICKRIRIKKE